MDFKELGRTGLKVPAIGMGTWGIGDYSSRETAGDNKAIRALRKRSVERDVLPYCTQQQMTVIAYTPLAKGRLSKSEFLREIGKRYQKTAVRPVEGIDIA